MSNTIEARAPMKAARLYGPADIRVEEVPAPPKPGPLQAVVTPLWSGICGTDIKEYTGHGGSAESTAHPLTGYAGLPLTLGHEFSARVDEVGSDITDVKAGDEVAVYPLLHCGVCAACLRGEYQICRIKAWNGLSSPWGGFGEKVLLEHYQLSPLNGISAVAGAVIEPAAVALNAVQRAGVGPGDSVFIAGAGAIGVLCMLAAKASGASRVYVFELNPKRAALVEKLGGELVPDSAKDDIAGYLANLTGGLGVDVAIDAAGKTAANEAVVASVRPGGTIGIPSVHPGPITFDVRRLTRNDLTVVGSVGYTRRAWDKTLELARAGLLPLESVVTARIELDEIATKGFDVLSVPSDELKILVRVGGEAATA